MTADTRRLFRISNTDGIKDVSEKLLGHRHLPPFLLAEDKYMVIAVGMGDLSSVGLIELMDYDSVDSVGLTYGVVPHGTDTFILHFLFVKHECRTQQTVLNLLEYILQAASEVKGVAGAIWKYDMGIKEGIHKPDEPDEPDEPNARIKLLSFIPFCRIGELKKSRYYRIKTVDIDFIRQHKIYKPWLWSTRGYEVQRLPECEKSLLDKIKVIEENGSHDKDYISPYATSGGIEQDERNTFILSKDGMPIGWIVCSIVSFREISISKFYMYPEARSAIVAHSFSTYVLDVLSNDFEYLSFNVEFGNRQMEMIARMYFEPILESTKIQCGLEIKFMT